MPTSIRDFFIRSLKTLPYLYLLGGLISFGSGISSIWGEVDFAAKSTTVDLRVESIENRRIDNILYYRSKFEANTDNGNIIQYSEKIWSHPKPHNEGDIVRGRLDPITEKIRTNAKIKKNIKNGKSEIMFGLLSFFLSALYFGRRQLLAFVKRRRQS